METEKPRILIFEDDLDLVGQWLAALRSADFECEFATSRVGAEELCRVKEFDAAIIDIFIDNPDGTPSADGGLTLLNHLRAPMLADTPAWGKELPILAVTGSRAVAGFDALDHARSLGADACVRKPISPSHLTSLIKDLLYAKQQGS